MTRVYRMKSFPKLFISVFLSLSLVFGAVALRHAPSGLQSILNVFVTGVLVLTGAFGTVQIFTARLVLTENEVHQMSAFSTRSLKFHQIRYRHEYEKYEDSVDGGLVVRYLELIPDDCSLKSIKITKDDFEFDASFWEWVLRVPEFSETHRSPIR